MRLTLFVFFNSQRKKYFFQAAVLLNQHAESSGKFTTRLFSDVSIMSVACHAYAKPGLDLRLIANHPGVQFEADFFQAFFD